MPDTCSLLAGWLIDGSGTPLRENIHMQVRNGRILCVKEFDGHAHAFLRPWTLPSHPPSAETESSFLDFRNCTLVPAFVDSHVHLFMSGTSDSTFREKQLLQPYEESRSLIHRHLSDHLSHGVLAVRDGGDHGAYSLRYKCERPPSKTLPRIHSPGKAWRAPARYGALIGSPPSKGLSLADAIAREIAPCQGPPSEQDTAPRKHPRPCKPDHVKIVHSGLNSMVRFARQTTPQFDLESLAEASNVCRQHGRKIMVHANGTLPVKTALQAGCDSIEHGFFMGNENLEQMAATDLTWVPTACTMQAYVQHLPASDARFAVAEKNLLHQLEQIRLAARLGVPIAVGTDAGSLGVHHGYSFKMEISLLMQAGFSLEGAIRCATFNGARLLGIHRDMGLLQPGMPATFLAIEAGPKDLPARLDRIQAVYSEGQSIGP